MLSQKVVEGPEPASYANSHCGRDAHFLPPPAVLEVGEVQVDRSFQVLEFFGISLPGSSLVTKCCEGPPSPTQGTRQEPRASGFPGGSLGTRDKKMCAPSAL